MSPDEAGQASWPRPEDVAAIIDLARTSAPRCGQVRVVAIDGRAGSGKTTLAAAVGIALSATVIHMDDLYPGWDGLAQAPGLVAEQVLAPLSGGDAAAFRRWDWVRGRWAESIDVPVVPVLVIEGCGCTVEPAGRFAAVRVWVDADRADRLRRGLERDGEAFAPHWQRWADQEDVMFGHDRTREKAHLVVADRP